MTRQRHFDFKNARTPAPGADDDVVRLERRSSERHKTVLRVAKLTAGEVAGLCVIRNLSSGGMMIDVHWQFSLGQPVAIELSDAQQIEGRVAWQKEGLTGIQFDTPIDIDTVLARPSVEIGGKIPRLPRLEVTSPARIQFEGRTMPVEMCDVSQRGAKFKSVEQIAVDSRITALVPGLGTLKGTIRWAGGDALGVVFDDVLPINHLMEWVAQQALQNLNGVGVGH